MSRLFGFAGVAFEDREASNGVGQIERRSLRMAAIDRQGFVIVGLRQNRASRVMVHVAEMPDRVRKLEGIVHLAAEGDCLFVMLLGRPCTRQTPLELSQILECPRQLGPVASIP